ncbi:MAG: NADH-quinone oxidoreductase subunit NuoE [Planctomycetota bacterium]
MSEVKAKRREFTESDLPQVSEFIQRSPSGRSGLIPVLHELQEAYGYLPEKAIARLSEMSGVSPNEIYGVATFYARFRFSPPGEHTIHTCLGTACHVRGGHQILAEFEQRLGIRAGEVTPDGLFDLKRVACVGCCALAPVAVIDGTVHSRLTQQKVRGLIKRYSREAKEEPVEA